MSMLHPCYHDAERIHSPKTASIGASSDLCFHLSVTSSTLCSVFECFALLADDEPCASEPRFLCDDDDDGMVVVRSSNWPCQGAASLTFGPRSRRATSCLHQQRSQSAYLATRRLPPSRHHARPHLRGALAKTHAPPRSSPRPILVALDDATYYERHEAALSRRRQPPSPSWAQRG